MKLRKATLVVKSDPHRRGGRHDRNFLGLITGRRLRDVREELAQDAVE